MAVLRTARLFTAQIGPAVGAGARLTSGIPRPADPDERVVGAVVYECPPAHRAVIREATMSLTGNPPPNEYPWAQYALFPTSGIAVMVYWHWFLTVLQADMPTIHWHASWPAMLVLNPGDRLEASHNATIAMQFQGSGALMPIG